MYVDDYTLAAPADCVEKLWSDIRKVVDMDESAPKDVYLGCRHNRFQGCVNELNEPILVDGTNDVGKRFPVTFMEYDMQGFVRDCVDNYVKLIGPGHKKL